MSQWKEPSRVALAAMTVAVVSLGVSVVALACRAEPEEPAEAVSRTTTTPPAPSTDPRLVSAQAAPQTDPGILVATAPRLEAPLDTAAASVPPPDATTASSEAPPGSAAAPGSLLVKRFVVTTAVHDREPVTSDAPLLADGTPIYAFAELVNGDSSAQQVTVRFERVGSTETVGNATLGVPAKVRRHRTWANTRFIREPGTWEAVLVTATGVELARTSFEVSSP